MADAAVYSDVSYRENGGSYTDVDGALAVVQPAQEQNQTLTTARGTDVVTRIIQQISAEFKRWSDFTALNTILQAGNNLDLKFTAESGTTFEYADMPFTVVPQLFVLNNVKSVWIDASGVGDNPTSDGDASWTELGQVREDLSITFNAGGPNNKLGQLVYAATVLSFEAEWFTDVTSDLSTYDQSTRAALAFEHSDGTYTVIDDVGVDPARVNLRSGVQELIGYVGSFSASDQDLTNIITVPASPANYEFGCAVQAVASGATLSDIVTITP